jgi:hypothetical protein
MKLDTLSKLLTECAYPYQLEHIECGILGAGFYPGARGFIKEQSPLGGILLLGRDFGTKEYYDRLCGRPARDETALTWRHTRDIYLSCFDGLPVWCTNYIVGVRKNGSSVGNIKDKISASEWLLFEEDCWRFLNAQVLLQRPRLVVVFGGDNRADLTAADRLGSASDAKRRHTFAHEGGYHTVVVAFADHPHSLIPKVKQNAARVLAQELREVYESEPVHVE